MLLLTTELLLPTGSPTALTEALEYEHYAVADGEGTLRDLISQASPIRQNGRLFHGYTTWSVDWQFWLDTDPDTGACVMQRHQVDVRGRIILPCLQTACVERQRQFDDYVRRLREHELGHYRFARQAGAAIERFFATHAPDQSLAELERAAQRGAGAILEQARQHERQYDIDTAHGRSQGAILP